MKRFAGIFAVAAAVAMTGCNEQNSNEDDEKIVIEVSDDSPYRVKDEETTVNDEKTENVSDIAQNIEVKPHTDSSDLTPEQLKGGYENLIKYKDDFEEKNAENLKQLGFEEKFNETKTILEKYKDTDFSKLSSEEFEEAYQELNNIAIQFDEFRNAIMEKSKKEN